MIHGLLGQWLCGLTTAHSEAMIKRCSESRSLYLECPECGYCSAGITLANPPKRLERYTYDGIQHTTTSV